MAIDTAFKRASIMAISSYFIGPSMRPAEIHTGAEARALEAYNYSGIAFAAPPTPSPSTGGADFITDNKVVFQSTWRRPSGSHRFPGTNRFVPA